jgi:hypothetical protein
MKQMGPMLFNSIKNLLAIVFVAFVALSGCATGQSKVWVADGVSFNNYSVFEIAPVFNATGENLKQEILINLTALLNEQFIIKQFAIANSSPNTDGVLQVKSSILVYEGCQIYKNSPPTTGLPVSGAVFPLAKSTCILRTNLIDKSTNRVVSEIYTTKVVGGCFTNQYKDQWLLNEVAADVATKVSELRISK